MRKSFYIFILVIALAFIGTLGYMQIEGWSFFDALYMTVITLTTTGYQEVHSLSHNGRSFTIFLLMIGMGIVAYSITAIMSDIVNIDWTARRRKKVEKVIAEMKGHTIVCGFGRMGKVIAEELEAADHKFVIIEKCDKNIKELQEIGYLFIEGDATHDEILEKAGIQNAKVLVSMVDNDADGMYITLAARSFNPTIYIIVRANEEEARPKMIRAGADKVILPVVMSGVKVAQAVINPAVEDYLDLTGVNLVDKTGRYQLADIPVDAGTALVGKTLRNCGFKRDGLIIVGIKKEDGDFLFAPSADYPFHSGDKLIALGTKVHYDEVLKQYGISRSS